MFQPELVLYFEVLIAFLVLVSYGLYRFSQGVRYQLWALGFSTYSFTGITPIVIEGHGLMMTDVIATSGMVLGSLFLLDGTMKKRRIGKELVMYIIAPAIGFAIVPIGLWIGTSYGVIYSIVGVFTTFSCWTTATHFKNDVNNPGMGFLFAYSGLLLWGVSTLLFLPLEVFRLLEIQVILTTTGVIATGAGFLMHFIRETNEKLEAQYRINRLVGIIFRHDIRNYVGTARESIEQSIASEEGRETWLQLSLEIINSMYEFVQDMRDLSAKMSRFEIEAAPVHLKSVLDDVSTRVTREYGLESGRISMELEEDGMVLSSGIVKELFWNIFDNAFKHGASRLHLIVSSKDQELVVNIVDDAGGLPDDVMQFLNNPDALSDSSAPGVGVGIIIIKGLSLLCDVAMKVRKHVNEQGQRGTLFELGFKLVES
ncbi:MAG: sensor histidine kinase [Candidatus Thorarchaeota archaeon]